MTSASNNLFLLTLFSFTIACSCTITAATTAGQANDTIQSGLFLLFTTYDEIHAREIQTRNNPIVFNKYNHCGVLYTEAVNSLLKTEDPLKSGDFQKLPPLASVALKDVQDCDTIFTPPGEETGFKTQSEKAIEICTNILNVVKGLGRGNI